MITAVEVGDNSETQGIGSKAIEQLPAEIVEANGIDGVDGVSGARRDLQGHLHRGRGGPRGRQGVRQDRRP